MFSIEMTILNLMQGRLSRWDYTYWKIERYKKVFRKAREYYDWSQKYIKEITK